MELSWFIVSVAAVLGWVSLIKHMMLIIMIPFFTQLTLGSTLAENQKQKGTGTVLSISVCIANHITIIATSKTLITNRMFL